MNRLFEFKELLLGYHGKPVLPSIDLTVNQGDFLGVVGPNGAGKTTFLKALLGIIKPLSGEIIKEEKIRFGYVPQRDCLDELYPISVKDVIMMARYPLMGLLGIARKEDHEAVDKSLKRLDIENLAHKPFRDLSGGQKQRTLIARALASNPDVLILDEPTNGMDIRAESCIMQIIDKLNQKGLTIIMVTHLLNIIARHAKKIMLLNKKVYRGTVNDLLTKETLSEVYGASIEVVSYNNDRKLIVI